MNKNVKINNPMKVITGPDTRWSYACLLYTSPSPRDRG